MATTAGNPAQRHAAGRPEARSPLGAVAEAAAALAEERDLDAAIERIVRAAAEAVGATVAIGRLREGAVLTARAVVSDSPALTALLEGSSVAAAGDGADGSGESSGSGRPAAAFASVAGAEGAATTLALPVLVDGEVAGSLELARRGASFTADEHEAAGALVSCLAAAIRRLDPAGGPVPVTAGPLREEALELAGEALAAATDELGAAEEVVRLAVQASTAAGGVLWSVPEGEDVRALVTHGEVEELRAFGAALAASALERQVTVEIDPLPGAEGDGCVVTLPLGRPARWALQLALPAAPEPDELTRLGTFAVRGLHALRAAGRARTLALELERTRALLAVAVQANEELSLSHTLETVIERVGELLGAERLGVYLLRDEGRLAPAAGRALTGPHADVADRLLELVLGPFRGRGVLVVEDAARDPRLAGLAPDLAAARIEAAVAVPLVVSTAVIGLLAVYPVRGRVPSENEIALVAALAAQLAVSVQNARLHERATQLGSELEQVLALERQAARQLRALYEISRSFAQSLSLETTLDAVVRTIVELLGVDAAVIRMPDARGELLVPRASHVADPRLEQAVGAVLGRPHALEKLPGRRLFRQGRPLLLDPRTAARLGPGHELLVPFLEMGATAAELPIATPTELLGTISLLCLDPDQALDRETIDVALSVAGQAALAIDNARLYQHQKEFADTMQRSLLPRTQPEAPGIEIGDVYESSARLEVGGDVYDFLTLEDGRLAVVLGDVTGHGIDAAADMAMAKFVFRSLAREHAEPGQFLAAANRVVCDEVGPAKFITMLYLTVDGATGDLAAACAGHPRPRLVHADGTVQELEAGGLALGIDEQQEYEEVRASLPRGASVFLYTDGVLEARRDGELYGLERLDRVLSDGSGLGPEELAHAVLADCRAFSRGELTDDCALVVIKRTGA
jgi:serine phosphatase RsbU (regulator of sigma subunit)